MLFFNMLKPFIDGVSNEPVKSIVVELRQEIVELLQFFRFILKSFF